MREVDTLRRAPTSNTLLTQTQTRLRTARRFYHRLAIRKGALLELHLARENIFVHHPVAHEAVQRVRKGSRLVLLEEEVTDPGKAVPGEGNGPEPHPVLRQQCEEHERKHQSAANEMQAPIDSVLMFAEVERIELGKASETLLFHGI